MVLRCPSTSILYDRLSARYFFPVGSHGFWRPVKLSAIYCRGYHETKLQENLDAEIFGVLAEEAREAFDEEAVVELNSEHDGDVENNCARISAWIEAWQKNRSESTD